MAAPVVAAAAAGGGTAAGAGAAAGGGTGAGAAAGSGARAGAAAGGTRVAASGRRAATRVGRKGPKHAAKGQTGRDAKQLLKRGGAYGAGAVKREAQSRVRSKLKAKPSSKRTNAQRVLVAEFLICVLLLALSPLGRGEGETKPQDWMKRGTAISAVFVMLGMLSAVGPRAGRTAAAIGGLICLVLAVDQRSIFATIADRLRTDSSGSGPQVGPPDDDQDDDQGAGRIGRRVPPRLGSARPRETR